MTYSNEELERRIVSYLSSSNDIEAKELIAVLYYHLILASYYQVDKIEEAALDYIENYLNSKLKNID